MLSHLFLDIVLTNQALIGLYLIRRFDSFCPSSVILHKLFCSYQHNNYNGLLKLDIIHSRRHVIMENKNIEETRLLTTVRKCTSISDLY